MQFLLLIFILETMTFSPCSSISQAINSTSSQLCHNLSIINFAFTSPLNLFQKISANALLKSEPNTSDCSIMANLEYRASNSSTFSPTLIQHKMFTPTVTAGGDFVLIMEFSCSNVVLPGLYQINLPQFAFSSGWVPLLLITSSSPDHLPPFPSLVPVLHLPAFSSIFPSCLGDLSLSWHLPNCSGLSRVLDFRIRMLASVVDAKEADELLYLEEFLLNDTNTLSRSDLNESLQSQPGGFLRIPCAQFDIIHEHFCFELISISTQSGHYQLWDRKCLRTEAITYQAQPDLWEWSEWSEWSVCSCHRRRGIRKRTRYCHRINRTQVERTTTDSRMAFQRKAFIKSGGCRKGEIFQSEKCKNDDHKNCAQKATNVPLNGISHQHDHLPPSISGNFTSIAVEDDPCRCGCRLSRREAGVFFAGMCPGQSEQNWELELGRPFRARMVLMPEGRMMGPEGMMALEVLRDGQKEMIWSNIQLPRSFTDRVIIIEENFQEMAIFKLKRIDRNLAINGDERNSEKSQGVLVDYTILAYHEIPSENLLAKLFSANKYSTIICSGNEHLALCSIFFVLCALFLLIIAIVLPPLVLLTIVKRWARKKLVTQQVYVHGPGTDSDALLVSSTHCHKKFDCEMLRSDQTDSTRVSNVTEQRKSMVSQVRTVVTVEQRSIGIQLSRQSTPLCPSRHHPLRRPRSSSRHLRHPVPTSAGGDHSNGSIESATIGGDDSTTNLDFYWNEDDDFGAEQLQLGGMAGTSSGGSGAEGSPPSTDAGLVSDIDIDKIVQRETSRWIAEPSGELRRDAFTQF